jgi:hypothetical protein
VLLALASGAYAQGAAKPETKPAASLPSVEQVLDKYVQALGGKAAIEKLTNRVAKGTFEIPAFGAAGTVESYAKAPNKQAVVIDIPGFGTIKQGFDGTVAWAVDPQSGMREQSGGELASTKRQAIFYRDLKLKEIYPKITVKGKEKVGEKDTYVLEATPADGSPEQWYFDTATGLLVRRDAEIESPQGNMAVQVYVDAYKEVDGIKIPSVSRQVRSDFTLNIKIDEVKHNVDIEDAKFVKPAN